jgi:hypothetical protein
MRPNLARDHDIFFAAVALLCGGILVFQSWRLDPILQFAQFLSIGSAIWFAYETIRLRGVTTEQAKRATPLVDNERPVSRVYRAELDEPNSLDEQRTVTRRIRGSRDSRSNDSYSGDYGNERPRSSRDARDDRDRPRRSSRPLPPERSDWEAWDGEADANRDGAARSGMRESIHDNSFSPRSRKDNSRPSPSPRRRGGSSDTDYVDYQPVDFTEPDNPRDEWR